MSGITKLRIADLNISIDCDSWTLYHPFEDFKSDFETPDLQWDVVFTADIKNDFDERNKVLSWDTQSVYRTGSDICITYGDDYIPTYILAANDWSKSKIYIDQMYNKPQDKSSVIRVISGLLSALKTIFFSGLMSRQGVLIHSASIIWEGKGILFSAPSGTGKSTQAHLWQEKYQVPILDGDSTACRIINGQPTVYGLPWCGSSGEYINTSLPLGAIVFLEQNAHNAIEKLDTAEAIVRLYARSYLFSWDEKMTDQALKTITEIVSKTDCYLLKCRPDFEAVELVKQCMK